MEQRLQPLHAERGIARRRRAKIVIHIHHIRGIRHRHPCRRYVLLAEGRRALIAEARERERRATTRRGAERSEFRLGAVVHGTVEIRGVGLQAIELRMMGVDNLAGLARGLKDTPKANDDVASAEVEVVDAAHPLSGKRFRLVSIERSTCPESCARVEWGFGLTLVLPLPCTNPGPRSERPTTQTRLSVEALEELVATAEGSEGTCPSSLGASGAICRPKL